MKKIFLFLVCLLIIKPIYAQRNDVNIEQLQRDIKEGIKCAYDASVRIIQYNTDVQKGVGGYFSGVVVDNKGHILTAAHAVKPNDIYLVTFPDGRQVKAKGLGVISSADAAMIVITDKGKWPIAKMGWSSTLESNVPCISISSPGSLGFNKPTVRLGYISDTQHESGFMKTTCLMEPGDSGGPLFDLRGRVVGIHSRIKLSLDDNFEVPIDVFRKYWTALQSPEYLNAFIPEDKVVPGKKAEVLRPVPEMRQLISNFKVQDQEFQKNVFTVKDSVNDSPIVCTLVDLNGLVPESKLKGKSFFISKNSMILAHPMVELVSGKFVDAKVLGRDEQSDLVLLEVPQEITGGVNLQSVKTDSVSVEELGNLLISPQPQNNGIVSVLGNQLLSIPKSPAAFLGIGVNFNIDTRQIVVTALYPEWTNTKGEIEKSSDDDIEISDVLTKINDQPIFTVKDLSDELSKYDYKQSVSLQYTKKTGSSHTKTHVLKRYYIVPHVPTDLFREGKSQRDNFKEVLVHDGKLNPSDCGGPLYSVNGTFYGINIARLCRTVTLAIPAKEIMQFVKDSKAF
ncbi:S1C family serine protease [Solitalea koreensis]|uniref:Serine protease Do n=1 Tax=Solitalea koreensis TaxID=543615 RepID=A0A521AVT9_9SPHI|nr:serine protease [Solitalea koreensis]SMO38690.1 serine protease Do [Solitalea koreensis]